LWIQRSEPLLPTFEAVLAQNYGAEAKRVDFVNDAEGAVERINSWVSENTEGRIPQLIGPDAIDSTTVLVLTNAIYFKASWGTPFDEGETRDDPFYLLDGTEIAVPMMRQEAAFPYRREDDCRAVILPYVGGQMSMVVIMPNEGMFETFEESLTVERITDIVSGARQRELRLYLPRFRMESQFQLNDALSSLGLADLFTTRADLSNMTGVDDIHVSAVIHQAFLEVDEIGTVAAAATAVVTARDLADGEEPSRLRIDHPFIVLIVDDETKAILFLGRVMNPR
jgi:serpin B